MATTYWTFPPQTFTAWDSNGAPVAAAEAKYFEAGTSTPLTIYTDTALTTPHAVPQVADANGVFAPVYISGPDEVKIEIRTSAGALLPGYPVDNITGIPVGGLTAAGVVFDPTATLAAVEVQTALETLDSITSRLVETVTAGSSNAYTLDPPLTITAYTDGMIFVLRADRDSTGAATLNVDTVGAKDWKRHDGSSYVAYGLDGIVAGNHYWVEYDSGAAEFHTIFERRPPANQVVTKTADETVNNSTTLQDDNHLVFAMAANITYAIDMVLLLNSTGDTPDFKFGWTVPSGCVMFWEGIVNNAWGFGGTVLKGAGDTDTAGSVSGTGGALFKLFVRNGANAGNLQLKWAQNTADSSDSKLLKHSHMLVHNLGAT